MYLPYGLVARIPGFHPGGSGSIPGMGITFFLPRTFIKIFKLVPQPLIIKGKVLNTNIHDLVSLKNTFPVLFSARPPTPSTGRRCN